MRLRKPTQLALFAIVSALTPLAHGATVTLDNVERGHFINFSSTPADNFGGTDYVVVSSAVSPARRGFFVFDLSAVRDEVLQATLRLQVDLNTASVLFDLHIWDFTSGADSYLGLPLVSDAYFIDLGSGTLYGTALQLPASQAVGSFIDIPLNYTAVSDLNIARGSLFTVGIQATGLVDFENVRFDTDPSSRQNQLLLSIVPEPAPLFLVMAAASSFCLTRNRRIRRRQLRTD